MAISITFITFIMPLSNVDKYYPGGVEMFKKEHSEDYEFDNFLCRTSAMGWEGIEIVINFWKSLGAVDTTEENGVKKFKDFCIQESLPFADTLPCDWIVIAGTSIQKHIAWHINDTSKPMID